MFKINRKNLRCFFRLYKKNKEVINLIPKMLINPGLSFEKFINQTNIKIIIKTLLAFYSIFVPLIVIWEVSIVYSYACEHSLSFLELIVIYILVVFTSPFSVFGFLILSFIFASVIGGIYFILGKILGSNASFYEIFSSIILYIAAASIFIVPIVFFSSILQSFYLDTTILITILSFAELFFHIFYLPIALSKGLKLNIFKSTVLMLLPLVLAVVLLLMV